MDISQITGLVLAGGQAERMGGADKGWQDFRGEPLVRHVVRRLAPQAGSLMISANRNLAQYRALGHPVWPDAAEGFAGPLAGMQSGLAHCATPYLLTAPCDAPFVPLDLGARLAESLLSQGAELAVACSGEGAARRREPVFCLMKRGLLPHLTAYMASGGRKVDAWYASLAVTETVFDDPAGFLNINTPDDLQR